MGRSEIDGVVRVLDEQPDLGLRLGEQERAKATAAVRARVLTWRDDSPGPIPSAALEPGAYGLLLLDGWLGLHVLSEAVERLELVGPGDLLRPWMKQEELVSAPADLGWQVVSPARLAILDRTFSLTAAPWPEIAEALMERLVLRSRRLVVQMTAGAQRRAEDRILLILWQLAERWGTVTRQGVELRVPLTHRMLGHLTGTRRPATTSAIGRLRAARLLDTAPSGCFVLTGPPLVSPG